MKELIRMDFYRLKKSNTLKICTGAMMIGLVGITLLFKAVLSLIDLEKLEAAGGDETELEALQAMDAYNFTLIGLSFAQILGIVICIFVAVYVAGEFQQRTINLSILKGYKREQIYFSKLFTTIIGTSVIYLASFLSVFVAAGICFGFKFNIAGSLLRFILVIIVDWCLYIALASFFVMISFITSHEGITMTVGTILLILLTTGFSVIDSSINGNSSIPFEEEVRSGKYWIATIIEDFSYLEIKNEEVIFAFIVVVGYLIITSIIGILRFRKKDLK
jgi:ABC-type transport system involved in multi-copper enzyme maturation permease subunit